MQYNKRLHRFTVFTAVSTLCLIVAGGLVTSTGSGLAVPDWPLSYGQIMPPMVGGILYEHGHRMIATFVGLLTIVLAIWYWKQEPRRWVRVFALVALGAVVTQGLLGGLTVLFLLPTPVSVAHATLAQTYFALISILALLTSKWWTIEQPQLLEGRAGRQLTTLSLFLILAVYMQLLLGALMRHTQSGLAIPDFPFAYGQLVPSLSPEAISRYNTFLLKNDIRIYADGPITQGQIMIHLLHRTWAIVVSVIAILFSVRLFRKGKRFPRLKFFAVIFPVLLVVQITLGALTVLTQKEFIISTAHVALGAVFLVMSVLATLHLLKLRNFVWNGIAPARPENREVLA